MLSARERLAPVVVIGTDDETDDRIDEWKGRPNTTSSGQNQGYYISRCENIVNMHLDHKKFEFTK